MREIPASFVKRLRSGIKESEAKLKPHREHRTTALRDFAGRHYGARGLEPASPVNTLQLAAIVYVAILAARNPQVRIRTPIMQYRPYSYDWQDEVNHDLRRGKAHETIREIVWDSMWGPAFAKVGLYDKMETTLAHETLPVGYPFWSRVSLDDYILDPRARNRREALFEGDRYRKTLEYVQDSGLFENTDNLAPTVYAYGDENRAENLGKGAARITDLSEFIDLCDIYIADEELVITLAVEGDSDKVLKVAEYKPPGGPYEMLGYHVVSDNAMPLPPVAIWSDLNEMVNVVMRKVKQQTERSKTVGLYEAAAEADAEAIRKADDGEWIRVDRVDKVGEHTYGGPDKELLEAALLYINLLSREAGNLDMMGGLAPRARTATEAAFQQSNAGDRKGDMRTQVENFCRDNIAKMAYFSHTDPLKESWVTAKLPGTRIEDVHKITSKDRLGDFLDYEFKVDPYSMMPRDPDSYAQRFVTWFTQMLLPSYQFLVMTGEKVNLGAAIRLAAKEMQLDEADEIFQPIAQTSDMLAQPALGGLQGNEDAGKSGEQRMKGLIAQQVGQKMPTMNPNQVPSNMDMGAVRALAGG